MFMKKKKIITLTGIMLLFAFLFYWHEIRPAQIKHDCSWVKNHSATIPAIPAMTESELKSKSMIQDCTKGYKSIFADKINNSLCESNNQRLIEEYKTPRDAIPAKSWWESASPQEYQFCLHNKGL